MMGWIIYILSLIFIEFPRFHKGSKWLSKNLAITHPNTYTYSIFWNTAPKRKVFIRLMGK